MTNITNITILHTKINQ